jgi:hypothetical protein
MRDTGWQERLSSLLRVGPCSSFTTTDDDAVLRQERPRFLATVPRLGGQREEARVMPLKVVVLMHTKPPLCRGADALVLWMSSFSSRF